LSVDGDLTIHGSGHTTKIGDGEEPYPDVTVTVTGNIIIDDSIELHGNETLESTGGRISITGAVDSVSGSTCSLTLTADDSVSIGGSVGGTHSLENLTIESDTGVTLSSTVTVTGSL
jgi:hypothetical protein